MPQRRFCESADHRLAGSPPRSCIPSRPPIPAAVALLRDAAGDALALGDAAGAAALLSRALEEPPADR